MSTIVVSGASRGIGRAVAVKFAQLGYNVVINSLHGNENLEATAEMVKAAGAECLMSVGDVGDSAYAAELINSAIETFGAIDVLVNNAGVSMVGLIQYLNPEQWARIVSSNLSSVHYLSSYTVPHMLKNNSGKIINISSVWGVVGASCEVAYSATKGGVNAYTKALAKELAPSGISVNAIACGVIDTDMNKCFDDESLERLSYDIPAGRMGRPEEVAELVNSIVQQSSYLTGQVITFDGGWT